MFPEASKTDIARVKVHLTEYKKMMKALAGFKKNPPTTEQSLILQKKWSQICPLLERAVEQILEYDVREVTEYRFIKGNSRAATILRFSSWNYCEKTIDRKINDGIVSIANTLLYIE